LACRNLPEILKTYPNFILLSLIAPAILWSAWRPFDRITWWLEVIPVFAGFIALFIAQSKGWRLSTLALCLVGFHMIVLLVGGHYTYALVPLGDWVSGFFGSERNHYDRLGHFTQGLVPAMICREIFLKNRVLARRGWLGFCVISFCLGFSATYELIEWAAALISAEASESFLGTQGDVWDTQWDMFLAGVGALSGLVFLSRAHDRSIAALDRFGNASPPKVLGQP
jgi:putative membrane protein